MEILSKFIVCKKASCVEINNLKQGLHIHKYGINNYLDNVLNGLQYDLHEIGKVRSAMNYLQCNELSALQETWVATCMVQKWPTAI